MRWHTATVREVIAENARARTVRFDVEGWPGHRAGQHVAVRLTAEDGYQTQRQYSIASAPEDPLLELTVELVDDGEVSPYLVQELRAGDLFEVRGPIGGPFSWSVDQGGPLLLLAGGSGLVPLMAMLRHRAARVDRVAAAMIVSVRTAADRLYAEELARLAPPEDLDVRHTFTRAAMAPGGRDFSGRLSAAMLAAVDPGPDAAPRIYVCGPSGFVDAAAVLLVAAGHPAPSIAAERFGPTG